MIHIQQYEELKAAAAYNDIILTLTLSMAAIATLGALHRGRAHLEHESLRNSIMHVAGTNPW
jgi:hypothetical protein